MIIIQRCALTAHYETTEVVDGIKHHAFNVSYLDHPVLVSGINVPLETKKPYTLQGRLVYRDDLHEFLDASLITHEELGKLSSLEPLVKLHWVHAVDKKTLKDWIEATVNHMLAEVPECVGNYVYGEADYEDFKFILGTQIYDGSIHPNVAKIVFSSLFEKNSYDHALVDAEGSLDVMPVDDMDYMEFLKLKRYYYKTKSALSNLSL